MIDLNTKGGLSHVGNENPSLRITTVKLDGSNYLPWSRSALLTIQNRGLSNYLTGEVKESKLGDQSIPDGFQKIL